MRMTSHSGRIFRALAAGCLLFGLTRTAFAQNYSLEIFTGLGTYGIVSFNLNINIPSNLASGTYHLGYFINDETEVPECDLGNNGILYWTLTTH